MDRLADKQLSASQEDYLEAIIKLEKDNRVARVSDIARFLSVQMPSVTGALKVLRKKGLVNYSRNSFISLTGRGRRIANSVNGKHESLYRFLREILLLPDDIARDEACKIEHSVDCETVRRLVKLVNFFDLHIFKTEKHGELWWKQVLEKDIPGIVSNCKEKKN